jgi:hypothetical protein
MDRLIGFGFGVVLAIGAFNILFPAPSLVGYGCDGAGGPIYAYEESDFPMCDKIEPR